MTGDGEDDGWRDCATRERSARASWLRERADGETAAADEVSHSATPTMQSYTIDTRMMQIEAVKKGRCDA